MWRVTRAMPAVSLGYSEQAFARLGSSRWKEIWWRRETAMTPLGIQATTNKVLDAFLAKEFTRRVPKGQEWQHKLSVALAEVFLKGKPAAPESIGGLHAAGVTRPGESIIGMEAAGLVYPSIATGAHDDNIALKCEWADSGLELAWVHYIEIARPTAKADEFTLKGLDFADSVSDSGGINWIGSFPNTLGPGTDSTCIGRRRIGP
jgi:hypothetical protein